MLFYQKNQRAKQVTPDTVITGNYFKSILPGGQVGMRSIYCPWEGVWWWQPRLRFSRRHQSFRRKMRFIANDPRTFILSTGASICFFPEFPTSHWQAKYRTSPFFFLPMLKWLIKMERNCLLSAFRQPWQNYSSNLITFWFLASSPILFSTFQRIN